MAEEFLSDVSSQELLDQHQENAIPDGGVRSCKGNISNECVRESLNEISDVLGGREDYVAVGGIPVQMEIVRRKDESNSDLMSEFGNRITDDLDILTTSPGELKNEVRESNYDSDRLLTIDVFDDKVIDEVEEIVERGSERSYNAYMDEETSLDADLRLPDDTDLFYTKIHDDYIEESDGTNHDASFMGSSGYFIINQERLEDYTRGNPEAKNRIQKLI
jgi:hypothetical protein